jgi:8-oxo-dGTP pyrophosphatase MutT (NUDIX family)
VPRRACDLVVRVLLVHGGSVLAAHHRHPDEDFWCLPGGKAEPGERLEDAARRELAEEAGLAVTLDGVVWLQDLRVRGRFEVIFAGRADDPGQDLPASPGWPATSGPPRCCARSPTAHCPACPAPNPRADPGGTLPKPRKPCSSPIAAISNRMPPK